MILFNLSILQQEALADGSDASVETELEDQLKQAKMQGGFIENFNYFNSIN